MDTKRETQLKTQRGIFAVLALLLAYGWLTGAFSDRASLEAVCEKRKVDLEKLDKAESEIARLKGLNEKIARDSIAYCDKWHTSQADFAKALECANFYKRECERMQAAPLTGSTTPKSDAVMDEILARELFRRAAAKEKAQQASQRY